MKSHFVVWASAPAIVSWVFLGSWWEALGMWQRRDKVEYSPWKQPWPDRQTDRHTSLCLYICAIPKILGILPQMSKHPSINEDLANASKQCIPINELALLLTLLPDLFNILFSFFPPNTKYLHLQPPAPWKLCQKEKKRLVWRFAASPSQVFTDLKGRK